MKSLPRISLVTVLLVSMTVSSVFSADVTVRDLTVYPFVQYFSWKELGDDGERLLKETGPQYGVGANMKLQWQESAGGCLTFSDRVELFGAEVDYKGQLQDGTPHETTVGYLGVMNRFDLGWALPVYGVIVEPFAGVGYRWWVRRINGAGGYDEQWSSLYSVFGARFESAPYRELGKTKFFWSAAAKYPFINRNNVDYPGTGEVELKPGNEWSVLADFGFSYRRLYAALFYENFLFSRSHAVEGLEQPRSESEIYGLRLGWVFK